MAINKKIQLWAVEDVSELSSEMKIVRNIYSGKLMIKRFSAPDSLETMLRLSRIKCGNLMEIYDAEIINGFCVTLCEYVSGATLYETVSKRGVYSETEAVGIITSICSGLTALHSHGVIHRDITPSNIMIDTTGCVKIIDFDIARTEKMHKTHDTAILGTEGYAAPEQFGFMQTDGRADIYSCGVLLNYLLTGKLPKEQLYRGGLTEVIRRCISLDPKDRFVSAEHLRAMLTGDRNYLRLLDKNDYECLRIRPLPGFRSNHFAPKFFTALGIMIYTVALLLHILTLADTSKYSNHSIKYYMSHVFIILIVYGCWTLFPYLLFGDAGRYSLVLTNDLADRRRINRLFGWLSILSGIVLFVIQITLYNYGVIEL